MGEHGRTENRKAKECDEKPDRLLTPRYLSAIAALFLVSGGNWIIVSPLTLLVESQASSETIAGFVVTGYAVGALLTRLFCSPFVSSKNYGFFVVLGAAAFGLASAVSLISRLDVLVLLAARFVQGLGQGIASVAVQAGVAYMLPASRLGEGISIVGTASTFALAVLPAAGLYVASSGIDGAYELLLIASVVFMVIVVAFGLYFQRGISKDRARAPHGVEQSSLSANGTGKGQTEGHGRGSARSDKSPKVFERGAWLPSLSNATVAYCQGFTTAFVALFCASKGFSSAGSFFSAFAATVLIVRLGGGRLITRFSSRVLMTAGFLLGAAGVLIVPFVPGAMIWLPAVLFGVCAGLVNPHLQVVAVSSCSREGAGSATGLFLAFVDVGMMVATVSGGLIIESVGYTLAFSFCAVVLVAGLLVYLLGTRNAS